MIYNKTPLRIYTPNFILLGEIDDYTSFIIKRYYNETGDFSLYISLDKNNTQYLQKNNLIIAGNNPEKVGIIKYREIDLDDDANEILIIKGFTVDCILNQRVISLPQNQNELIFNGKSSALLEKLVNENLVNSIDPNRNIENLIINSNDIGNAVLWKLEPRYVGDESSKIAKIDNIGYKIIGDLINRKLVFKVYTGKDLTEKQDINPKVVFSPAFNNIQGMKHIDNSIEEKNVVYINTGVDNFLTSYGEAAGLNRQETYLDHGELKESETISDIGKNELSKFPRVDSITGSIIPYNSFVYEKDYNLGDIVTAKNPKWNITKDLRITAIEEVYENKPKVNITLGEPSPTFVKKIKNYITNMN